MNHRNHSFVWYEMKSHIWNQIWDHTMGMFNMKRGWKYTLKWGVYPPFGGQASCWSQRQQWARLKTSQYPIGIDYVLQILALQKHKITLLRVIPTMTFIHFLTGKSSGILSDISSGILSGISSGICSGISSGLSSGILSGKSSGILSGISSGIYSDISSGICSGISSGILSGISSGIYSDISSGILSRKSSGISSGILSGISSGILSGISHGYLLAFYLTFHLAYLLAFYLATCKVRSGIAPVTLPHTREFASNI